MLYVFRMDRIITDSFLEEFSPPLITSNQHSSNNSIVSNYTIIQSVKCFKPFVSLYFKDIESVGLSTALDEIRGMETFRNLHSTAFDNSDELSSIEKKAKFFFGDKDNLQVMWDYCILSKMDSERSSEELDEGDLMHLENFEAYAKFFATFKTLEAKYEDEIMDLFRYFVGRDMILLANDVERENAQN